MFLKSLTLKGFKSFAESTTLELEPGITVVVGPNGSGKSNVVDAVAWVLGSQGPRALRSSKMEDVIFAGSAKRPALGRAEVSLTIDNSSGILPVEFPEVTLTRTLFRSGDSEYAVNGVPCRLLDIQELLSDTGVGRQQHVIVSQGQLAAILDARPEDRRLVVEEAAGVLKYRRRREKAQRRLDATEGNLVRLQDLMREVRRQLRPLQRQAESARRHAVLAAELAALRLHLAGAELTELEDRLQDQLRTRAALEAAVAAGRAELHHLDEETAAAEAAVPPPDAADELGDALVRYEALRERGRGMAAVLAQRGRGIAQERRAAVDEGVVAALEAEAAALAAELASPAGPSEEAAAELHALESSEAALAAERAVLDRARDGIEAPAGRAAEVRGELQAVRRAMQQGRAEADRLEARRARLGTEEGRLRDEADRLRGDEAAAGRARRQLAADLESADARRAAAEGAEEEAASRLREAEAERHRWGARVEALALALDQARARAGMERLADVPGVVGTLLDVVDVDEGWAAAFEAAVGEALAAVVVDGVDAARLALGMAGAGNGPGSGATVVPLDGVSPPASLGLDAAAVGGEPVRSHVRARWPHVERLLDGLLGHAVAVEGGWEEALDVALAHPGLVVVTRGGDRFASTGWRAGASAHAATGAALDEARSEAEAWAHNAARAGEALGAQRAEVAVAREAVDELAGSLEAEDARLGAARAGLERLEAARRALAVEDAAIGRHLAEVADRLARDGERTRQLEAALAGLEVEEEAAAQRRRELRRAGEALDQRAAQLSARRTALEVESGRAEQRLALLSQRLAEIDRKLADHASRRAEAHEHRLLLDRLAAGTERLAGMLSAQLAVLDAALARLHQGRRRHQEAARTALTRLAELRRLRSAAEEELESRRERARQAELEEAEIRLRLEAAEQAVTRELGVEPSVAKAAPCPDLPVGVSAATRRQHLDRELTAIGPVNPLALEEHELLEERHRFLEAQLEDVRSARRDLAGVIRAVDREIVEVFSAAFADVSENFAHLFSVLFPGGTGRLRLTDPDDLLDTGIEVEARPSGKNVRKLSLLSGGERALTALAFLFAVFRSRPSPFYLLDEVEAALDDVNLHRFLGLIKEFRKESQLLVVTHQKRTMEAADCLYGVTLQPGGSSRVVSERVRTPA